MEDFKKETIDYTGVCKCCLQNEDNNMFLGLWDQHLYDGNLEIYGEMITQCFLIPLSQPEDPEINVEQICLNCVSKLRDAYSFKQQLLAVENQLASFGKGSGGEEEKYDKSGMIMDVHIDDNNQEHHINRFAKPDPQLDQVSGSKHKDSINQDQPMGDEYIMKTENSDVEYTNVEYIEEECPSDTEYLIEILENSDSENTNVEHIQNEGTFDTGYENQGQKPSEMKRRSKNKKKGEKIRNYKNYSQKDMRMAVQCAFDGTLTQTEAAAKFGVPRRTIRSIIRRHQTQSLSENALKPIEGITRVKMTNLITNIVKILTYTNATPYKATKTSYGCVYCAFVLNTTTFEDAEVLRAHTRVEHANERLQAVKNFMRPHKILKVDIYNLVCTVCCEAITGWMKMFEHLNKAHDVVLDEAYTKVIPYVLDISSYKCAICNEKFNNYHHLDTHMNCHYNNYVCAECGDTFLTRSRITAHLKVHDKGKYPCDHPDCGKVFSLERYKKKHYMLMHTNEKRVQCQYCEMKFHDAFQKHLHIVDSHKEKVIYTTCDICGLVFDWKPTYYAHMGNKHKNDCSIRCEYCNMLFTNKALLKRHMRKHTIDVTNYCDVCNKTYSSQQYLKQHKWKMHKMVEAV